MAVLLLSSCYRITHDMQVEPIWLFLIVQSSTCICLWYRLYDWCRSNPGIPTIDKSRRLKQVVCFFCVCFWASETARQRDSGTKTTHYLLCPFMTFYALWYPRMKKGTKGHKGAERAQGTTRQRDIATMRTKKISAETSLCLSVLQSLCLSVPRWWGWQKKMRVNKKCILSLRLPSKCSFTPSKLRFFGLRKPKTTSFYSLSLVMKWPQ